MLPGEGSCKAASYKHCPTVSALKDRWCFSSFGQGPMEFFFMFLGLVLFFEIYLDKYK